VRHPGREPGHLERDRAGSSKELAREKNRCARS